MLGEAEGGKSQAALPQRPWGWSGDGGTILGLRGGKQRDGRNEGVGREWQRKPTAARRGGVRVQCRQKAGKSGLGPEGWLNSCMPWAQAGANL